MKLATTTGDFDRFCPTYEERVSHLVSAGFRHIDLSLYSVKSGDALLSDPDWKKNAHALLEHTHRLGADFVQAHSAGFNPLLKDGLEKPMYRIGEYALTAYGCFEP